MTEVITISSRALQASCSASFLAIDFSSLTATYTVDAASQITLFNGFDEYSDCALYAYPVFATDGLTAVSSIEFISSPTTGTITFTRAVAWSLIMQIRICTNADGTDCITSSSQFTITV